MSCENPDVYIIMGSESDAKIMKPAGDALAEHCVYAAQVVSAHRTPDDVAPVAKLAEENGVVVIAGAGGAAHLPGMTAAHTIAPVFGVPVGTTVFGGLDSQLSNRQMPRGVPLATVNVNGAKEAGEAALRIVALRKKPVKEALSRLMEQRRGDVRGNIPDFLREQLLIDPGAGGSSIEILMESENDPLAREAAGVLAKFGVPHRVHIIPLEHQTTESLDPYLLYAEQGTVGVLIADVRLATVIAARTLLPILSVPPASAINLYKDQSIRALVESMASPAPQLAYGLPGAHNASLLGLRILGLQDPRIRRDLRNHQAGMIEDVAKMNERLHGLGLMGPAQKIPL